MTTVAPDAISAHLDTDDLPWAVWDEGVEAKMLRVSRETGTWVIINRFAPGKRIPTHHHDGAVHAYTLKGRWHYLEYDFVASPGSFVFEQAGSTHTLEAMPDSEEPVEVFFVIEGGLILYDDDGNYFGYTDAQMALDERRRPFDPRGPLARALVAKLHDREHVLVLTAGVDDFQDVPLHLLVHEHLADRVLTRDHVLRTHHRLQVVDRVIEFALNSFGLCICKRDRYENDKDQ